MKEEIGLHLNRTDENLSPLVPFAAVLTFSATSATCVAMRHDVRGPAVWGRRGDWFSFR